MSNNDKIIKLHSSFEKSEQQTSMLLMGLSGSLLATFTTTAVKNSRKNEFWFFKTLSRLFSLAQCVRMNFLGNWILKDSSKFIEKKREKKSSSFVDVLQSIRPGIKTFHVVVVQWM